MTSVSSAAGTHRNHQWGDRSSTRTDSGRDAGATSLGINQRSDAGTSFVRPRRVCQALPSWTASWNSLFHFTSETFVAADTNSCSASFYIAENI